MVAVMVAAVYSGVVRPQTVRGLSTGEVEGGHTPWLSQPGLSRLTQTNNININIAINIINNNTKNTIIITLTLPTSTRTEWST